MRVLAFGHLVPARPEDCGSLAHHPKQQGALFSSLEHPRRRHPRLSEPTEGRPEGEAEKVGGTQEGGQRRWRTAASWRPKRAHEGLLSGQNARLRGGVKIPRPHRERDRMAPVSRSTAPRQFSLHPYKAWKNAHVRVKKRKVSGKSIAVTYPKRPALHGQHSP